MDLQFKDKLALVTGAGSQIGYGKTIALTLAKEGCNVVAADIDIEGAQKTADSIAALGRSALAIKVDVGNRDEVDAMITNIMEKFNKIDILVNNAGVGRPMPFIETTREDWDFTVHVNLYGLMNVTQSVLPHMIARKYGRIVNISGGIGCAMLSVYGTTKAGVKSFTQSLAKEVTHLGIIVNAVEPGLALTGLTKGAPSDFLENFRQGSLLKRFCTPEDLAPLVAFLASDTCSYMVGQYITLEDPPPPPPSPPGE
jgi:NAD(P)-dependent dehydrogenase (short-subunit alcohol dehydrogenase family)